MKRTHKVKYTIKGDLPEEYEDISMTLECEGIVEKKNDKVVITFKEEQENLSIQNAKMIIKDKKIEVYKDGDVTSSQIFELGKQTEGFTERNDVKTKINAYTSDIKILENGFDMKYEIFIGEIDFGSWELNIRYNEINENDEY